MLRRLAVLLAITATAAAQGPTQRTDLPVTSIALFSSGVGYFEHGGTVRSNTATELRFKTAQINDVLKSLVLQDLDGGRVTTVVYPSQDPIGKTLRSFQVDITANPGMADLLNQLRGARVSLTLQADRIAGTILGVETRTKTSERGERSQTSVLNVLTGATIRSVPLEDVGSLSLEDPQLQDELTKALVALSTARDQDKKPVTINFTGSGDRRVRLGYVVETPVWKTSYRLLLDDKAGRLQGWAIVENQTESDWNNVSLALVSGRPISFSMDLYQPLYATRPVVYPERYSGLRPQVYDGGMAADRDRVGMGTGVAGAGGAGGGRGGRGGGGSAAPAQGRIVDSLSRRSALGDMLSAESAAAMMKSETVQSIAESMKLGELFQYNVPNVTLPRQKSAMLPIVTDSVGIERVSIYNASVLRSKPLNGVILRNVTGKHLLQGPVTVIDRGGYGGDARIDDVPPGQERLLSFGIDLEMSVDDRKNTSVASVVAGRIDKGVLTIQHKLVSTQEYAADNKTGKEKTLVVEHPIKQGWKIVDTPKPMETTPALYRFKGVAAPEKVTVLTVKEELVTAEEIAILDADREQILVYARSGEIARTVRDALVKAAQLKQAVAALDQEIESRNRSVQQISQEQGRIRENMKIAGQTTAYYTRLLAKLNEQESEIERLQKERDGLVERRAAARKELEDYVRSLTIA